MSNQIQENIFQSIDYIVEARMSEIAKDITELCTVVKVYEEKDNKPNTYYVSNGQLKFDAIAQDGTEYTTDTQVYVLIPNGDYSGNKLILGSYKSEDPYKYKYITPEDEILKAYDLGPRLFKNNILYDSITIPRVGFDDEFTHMLFTFHLSTSDFANYTGQYTLEFVLADYAVNANGEYIDAEGEVLPNQTVATTYGLSIPHTELYGNPYEYDQNYPISYIIPIYKIVEKNPNFRLYNIKSIKYAIKQTDSTGQVNLYDCQISFGYAAKDFENNSTQVKLSLDNPITTPDVTMEKDSAFEYSQNSKKSMSFDFGVLNNDIFTIYNETNTYSNDYKAYWCRYDKEHEKDTSKSDIEESGTHWKTMASEFLSNSNIFQRNEFAPNIEWDEDRIKVIVRYEGELQDGERRPYWESNILVFRNLANAPSQGATNANVNPDIELQLADNDDGNYNIYGTDYRLVSHAKKNQVASVSIKQFFDGSAWSNSYTAIWKIPYSNSMLKPLDGDKENWKKDDEDKPKFWIKEVTNLNDFPTINYGFLDIYYSNRIHNTIYCEVQKTAGGKTYYGSIDFTFGLTNTNGSNYALNIVPEHFGGLQIPNQETGEPYSIKYTARLEDEAGQEVAFNVEKLKWSWYYGDNWVNDTDNEGNIIKDGEGNAIQKDLMAEGGLSLTLEEAEADEQKTGRCIVTRTANSVSGWARPRAILKVVLEDWTNTNGLTFNLEAYHPIGMGAYDRYITGATRIMYDYSNHLGSYDNTPYELYNIKDGSKIATTYWVLNNADGVPVSSTDTTKYPIVGQDSQEYPTLKPQINKQGNVIACSISPLGMINTIVKPCYIWMAQEYVDNDETKVNAHWWQPILIAQDTYASDLVNDWNGELSIDAKGNKILAQSIGAGIKNSDNTYTGVIMGKVVLNEGTTTETTDYGLYGFRDGELKFKFDEQGNGYLAGKVEAASGKIRDWIITSEPQSSRIENIITRSNNQTYRVGMQALAGEQAAAFYAGCKTPSGGSIAQETASNFYVTNSGYLFANNVKISGHIEVNTGTIGKYFINENGFIGYNNGAFVLTPTALSGTNEYSQSSIFDSGTWVIDWAHCAIVTQGFEPPANINNTHSYDLYSLGDLYRTGVGPYVVGATLDGEDNIKIIGIGLKGTTLYIQTANNNLYKATLTRV